jgi:hypothetical protein
VLYSQLTSSKGAGWLLLLRAPEHAKLLLPAAFSTLASSCAYAGCLLAVASAISGTEKRSRAHHESELREQPLSFGLQAMKQNLQRGTVLAPRFLEGFDHKTAQLLN